MGCNSGKLVLRMIPVMVSVVALKSSNRLLGQLRTCRSREAKVTACPNVLSQDRRSSDCMEMPVQPIQPMSWKMRAYVQVDCVVQRKGSDD